LLRISDQSTRSAAGAGATVGARQT
jgi:hypothetical protein